MIRLLYIVAQPVRWVAFEWIAGTLDPKRFRLSFLLLSEGPPALGPYLDELEIPWLHLAIRHRSQVPWLARRIAEQCRKERIQIVHAHFMNSCLAGLTGAFLAGVKCRLHTRHHAGPFPSSHRPWWGKFYDQYNNRLSTRIVVPSRQVENVLVHRERVSLAKLVRIYHGFDLGSFSDVPEIAVELMREKYELGNRWPVVGVVARYEEIKGVHFIIEAFHALLIEQPGACLVLANARGKTMPRIREQLARLPPDSYREILFEENMPPLYALFDLFVHAPLAAEFEAFGQVYV